MTNTDERRLRIIRKIVREQAFDEGLWGPAHTAFESHLLDALARLHRAVRFGQLDDLKEDV
jgi:hypothetical protein